MNNEEIKLPNRFVIQLEDNINFNQYNEGFIFERQWYGTQEDTQVLDIETFYQYCKSAAAAMGFAEKTIEEWFGNW